MIARTTRLAHAAHWVWIGARAAAGAVAVTRLARGARAAAPLGSEPEPASQTAVAPSAEPHVTVIVPARNEAERLAPCLRAIVGAPGVTEVIVVDDESSDGTGALATSLGARVVFGAPLPAGWVGKPWALQQGLLAAGTDWIVTLDADTEPDPALVSALVTRARADGWDFLSVGGRFTCPTPALQLLHPAMLATLVYRFGPPGTHPRSGRRPSAKRVVANGQCTVFRRSALLTAGGFNGAGCTGTRCSAREVPLADDVALARHLARIGRRVGFLDATDLLTVRMHASARDAWVSWGRTLPLADVTAPAWQVADLAVVWLAQALPIARVAAGRADALDVALALARAGTHAAVARAYDPPSRTVWWWLGPLADLPVAARLTQRTLLPDRTWRGRSYRAR